MAIRKADVPHATSYLDEILKFIDSGWASAVVDMDGVSTQSVYQGIRRVLSRKPEETRGVKCMMRGGQVYLVRKR